MTSDLPTGWASARLLDLGEINPKHSAETYHDQIISFVPMAAVSETKGCIVKLFDRPLAEIWKGYTHFAEGDVLFAKITPCMENGKSAIARNLRNGLGCGSTEFYVMRPNGAVLPDYVHPFLRQQSYRAAARAAMTGAVGQLRVPKSFVENTVLPLPPLNEQRRIVAKIEALMARSARARKALDAIPALLDRYRQSVLAAAFRGDLTADWRAQHPDVEPAQAFLSRRQSVAMGGTADQSSGGRDSRSSLRARDAEMAASLGRRNCQCPLPSTWTWTGIGEVFGVYVGATPSRREPSYWGGDILWVSSGEVAFCRISSTQETITKAGLKNTSSRIHPPGTVLLGMIGEGKTRGQTAILNIAACNNQNCAAIRVSEAGYPPEYLYWYLVAEYERTRTLGGGNNQPALNKQRVQRLPVPLAPVKEAGAIAEVIERVLTPRYALVAQAAEARRRMDELEQSILAKAFRGELVPQDPNDEPASELLTRIKAERAAPGTPSRRGGRRKRAAAPVA